jgi:hypothetical protein
VSCFYSGEVTPEEALIIYETCKEKLPLTQEQRKTFEQEWADLSESEGTLRIWKHGRIISVPEDYFDPLIIRTATRLQHEEHDRKILCLRLVGELIGRLYAEEKQYIPDQFAEYRIRRLVGEGIFRVTDTPKGLWYCKISLAHHKSK